MITIAVVQALAHPLLHMAGELNGYVVDELNVRSVVTCSQPMQYSTVRAVPQWQVRPRRLLTYAQRALPPIECREHRLRNREDVASIRAT